jgi:hypothetical protein
LNRIGTQRLAYPPNHIEADNRLSWILGRLDREFNDGAFYVHLARNQQQTSASFAGRQNFGIMQAYKEGILLGGEEGQSTLDIAADYIDTVESNITMFLKDKNNKMEFCLESAKADFSTFWKRIGADGNLEEALKEWDISYNAST